MRCGVLHRWLFVWSLTAVLYGCAAAFASEAGPGTTNIAPRSGLPPAVPLEPAIAHIGLLVPASSSAFANAAEAVKRGFLAAAKIQGSEPLPIRVYDVGDDSQNVLSAYRRALAAGARLVVGPLTRGAVTTLASSGRVAVPTLALNVLDGAYPLPPNLYVLSLHVEAEARQVARLAIKEGRLNAFTITGETPVLRRIRAAFVEEFSSRGGHIISDYEYTSDAARLARIRQTPMLATADMVFLALDYPRARAVRPYLGTMALYATSQVNPGTANPLAGLDLASVRFLDMPWLLQPDHPAVMVYPRAEFHDALDLQRLYALGIDAYRVGAALLKGQGNLPLDGVTGHLRLGPDHLFVRELTGAQFADGKLLIFAGRQ
jgi:outer membrane PBP1 activator LpoA protein